MADMATQTGTVTKGLLVRIEAQPGREADVEAFLDDGLQIVLGEPATTAWFAIKLGKTWVLDTETKGTGAQMVPLELRKPEPGRTTYVPPKPRERPPPPAEPVAPRRFKVTDVMTREVLAQDADVRATVDLLSGVRSIVDVHVFVWNPRGERWRMLTLAEQRMLWELRGR